MYCAEEEREDEHELLGSGTEEEKEIDVTKIVEGIEKESQWQRQGGKRPEVIERTEEKMLKQGDSETKTDVQGCGADESTDNSLEAEQTPTRGKEIREQQGQTRVDRCKTRLS